LLTMGLLSKSIRVVEPGDRDLRNLIPVEMAVDGWLPVDGTMRSSRRWKGEDLDHGANV
jgi:hypothetical protein